MTPEIEIFDQKFAHFEVFEGSFSVLVESYDSRILRFERFEDSAESSNRILKPKDVESNLESNLKTKGCRIESRIES